jgi:Ca2+-binding RTX toxin-like protein/uncharacterized protein YegL
VSLIGDVSLANYQAAIQAIRFNNTGDAPDTENRVIEFTVENGVDDSAVATTTLGIVVLNPPPTLDLDSGVAGNNFATAYTEGLSPVAIADGDIEIIDNDDEISIAFVTLTNPQAGDELIIGTLPSGITATELTFTNGAISVRLSSVTPLSADQYEAAIRAITYNNTSANPSGEARIVEVVVGDANSAASSVATTTISFFTSNDAPTIDLDTDDSSGGSGNNFATTYYSNGGNSVSVGSISDDDINVSDVDNVTLQSATITLTDGLSGDKLDISSIPAGFTVATTITGTIDPNNGALTTNGSIEVTLTGAQTLAQYQAAIAAIAFETISVVEANRTVTVVVNDGDLGSSATTTISVVDAGAVPTLDLDGSDVPGIVDFSTNFVEGGGFIGIVDPTVVITDDNSIVGATVVLTVNGQPPEDSDEIIVGSLPPGISYAINGNVLTFSGEATVADYQSALLAIQYNNNGTGSSADRELSITVNDGASESIAAITTIVIEQIPTITIADVSVTEPSSSTAVMTFTVNIDEALDYDLMFNYQTVDVSATGGSDYVVVNQTATIIEGETSIDLSAIVVNSDTDNLEGDETYTVDLSSFVDSSNGNAPVTVNGDLQAVGTIFASDPVPLALADSFSMVANPAGVGAPFEFTVDGNDTLINGAIINVNGWMETPPASGIYTFLSANMELVTYNAGTNIFSYNPSDPVSGPQDDTFVYNLIVPPGNNTISNDAIVTITVNPSGAVLLPPVVDDLSNIAYTENAAAVSILDGVNITDNDGANLSKVVVTINNYRPDQDITTFSTFGTNVEVLGGDADIGANTWTLTLLAGAGVAGISDFVTVLESIEYANSSDNPFDSSRTFSVQAFDDALLPSNVAQAALAVVAVNDAPIATDEIIYIEADQSVSLNVPLPADVDTNLNLLEITVISISSNAGTFFNGTTSLANSQTITLAELNDLTFQAGQGADGEAVLTYAVSDGSASTQAEFRVVVGSAADDLITVFESGIEGTPATLTDPGIPSGSKAGQISAPTTVSGNLLANDASVVTAIANGFSPIINEFNNVDMSGQGASYTTTISQLNGGGESRITVYLTAANGRQIGDYDYELTAAYSQTNNQAEVEVVTIPYVVRPDQSGTLEFTKNLIITIEDDVPTSFDLVEQVPESEESILNIVFMLDVSGSMDIQADPASLDPETRLDVAKEALIALANQYFDRSSNVDITLLTFANGASTTNNGNPFTTKGSFEAGVNNLVAGGGTNYGAAANLLRTTFTADIDNQSSNDVVNVSYFISDGATTNPAEPGDFITYANNNGIASYSVGIGQSIPADADLDYFHNVDSLGRGEADKAIIVRDLSLLEEQLFATLPEKFGGNVTVDGSVANVRYGADGGYIATLEIVIDVSDPTDPSTSAPTTYTFIYDPSTNTISLDGSSSPMLTGFTTDNESLTINENLTALGNSGVFPFGEFIFDFLEGEYTFTAPPGTDLGDAGETLGFQFTVVDGDGSPTDPIKTTATLNIIDDKPFANDDLHTRLPLQIIQGNVINGIGTDGGPQFGSQQTAFASQGSGVDQVVDGAVITEFTFQGATNIQTFDLTSAPTTSVMLDGLEVSYAVSSALSGAQIITATVQDASDPANNPVFQISNNGYYKYSPVVTAGGQENLNLQNNNNDYNNSTINLAGFGADGSPQSLGFIAGGLVVASVTETGFTLERINEGEYVAIDFTRDSTGTLSNVNGVQNVTLTLSSLTLGDFNNETVDLIIYAQDTTTVLAVINGVDAIEVPGLPDDVATINLAATDYAAIGRIDLISGPSAYVRIRDIQFDPVTTLPAGNEAPVLVDYLLTDTDNQTDSGRLSIYTPDQTILGDDNANSIAPSDVSKGYSIGGAGGDDVLTGGDQADSIAGGDGIDVIAGNGGNDYLVGGLGNDQITGGAGADRLDGGDGNDDLSGDAGDDIVVGGIGDDKLFGGENDDRLIGGADNDELDGQAGEDYLDGGDGLDILIGGDGDDLIIGGANPDFITGGAGDDILTGGDGIFDNRSDEFVFELADIGTSIDPAVDIITDFSFSGPADSLNLKDLLIGEDSDNLNNFLLFELDNSDPLNPNTNLLIDHNNSSGGAVESNNVTQKIVFEGVDLFTELAVSSSTDLVDLLAINDDIIKFDG